LIKHVVEWRSDVVDRDGIVGKAEDTVEPNSRVNRKLPVLSREMYILAEGKSQTRLFGGLRKVLVADRDITDGKNV
jgi:hypothetical protein